MGNKGPITPSAGSERGCDARVDSIGCGGVLLAPITSERRGVLSNSTDIHIGDLASVLLLSASGNVTWTRETKDTKTLDERYGELLNAGGELSDEE